MTTTTESLRAARGRQAAYEWLGRALADAPDERFLAATAADVSGILQAFGKLGLDVSSLTLVQTSCLKANEASITELRAGYVRLFEGHHRVYPYASCWGDTRPRLMGPAWESTLEFYVANGVTLESDTFRADHVSTQLLFLALLAQRMTESEEENLERLTETYREFLAAHVSPWMPKFLEAVVTANRSDFYSAVAKLALQFIELDTALIGTERKLAGR